jgi:AmmeMemoRadiSam system protein A
MGKIINEAVNKLDRKVVYIASGDLSHKLQVNGPYGFIEEGPIYDKKIIEVMSNARFKELLEFDLDFLDKAAECGHRSFIMMSGFLNNIKVKPKFYSHQDVTGVGYGICSYYPVDPYVELAKETIEEYIKTGKVIDIPTDLPKELTNTQQATFVSIHKNNDLRGCIGTIYPTRENTAKEIISNAISASTRDPRFNPITEDELDSLEINVDVLTLPESIEDKSKLDPKKYGVIVSTDTKRGVLLPDLEGVDSVEQQILIAKNKAGILPNEEIKLQRFEVIRHK